jgi:acyl carrier protein
MTIPPPASRRAYNLGMAATVSSRTPEGEPKLCPVCGALICIEPSTPSGDGPCPGCGVLLWFLHTSRGVRLYEVNCIASIRERAANILARALGAGKEELTRSIASIDDFKMDSLDIVELVMDFEDEFGVSLSDAELQHIRTLGDLIEWLVHRLR